MKRSDPRARTLVIVALVAVAVLAGIIVTMASALLGHELLVVRYGEEGIAAIDDTPLMFALVAGAYLAGFVSGLAVLAAGWRRFLRGRS